MLFQLYYGLFSYCNYVVCWSYKVKSLIIPQYWLHQMGLHMITRHKSLSKIIQSLFFHQVSINR